jgi:hypothetical protein
MSVIVEIEEEQGRDLFIYLKTLPFVAIRQENKLAERSITNTDWRSLAGKYAQSGINSASLERQNQLEKEQEDKQGLY